MKIIVAVDGSSEALAGARWVAHLPLSVADEVVVVAVTQQPELLGAWGYAPTEPVARLLDEAWKDAEQAAHRAVDGAAEALAGADCNVQALVLKGHPIDALERVVQELGADLLAVGPHGRGRIESILLGSVTQSLLHAMPTSILVARSSARSPQRILLAIDGSAHGLAAARYLARLPLPSQARIDVIVSVLAWSDSPTGRGVFDLRHGVLAEQRQAADVVAEAVEILEAGGRTGHAMIRHGEPKREILSAAREHECDLIVTGARGVGGFKGLFLGSVSRAVSKAAPCSTLVVRSQASAAEEAPR